MPLKKQQCQNWKLYVIADKKSAGRRSLAKIVRAAILGGADVIQLRDKHAGDRELLAQARALLKITKPFRIPLIVNDRAKVAQMAGADGVHLGQEDGDLKAARKILGPKAIVGRSTHSMAQALKAQKQGFDYIGVGPVFQTPTKPSYTPVGLDLVHFASKRLKIPFVAIGGIDLKNLSEVRAAGAKTVAVVRAVCIAKNPKKACEEIIKLITKNISSKQ